MYQSINVKTIEPSVNYTTLFQEDVESYLKKEQQSIEDALKDIEEKYRRYKYVESTMTSQKQRLLEKLPEFHNSLSILEVLIEKKVFFETKY